MRKVQTIFQSLCLTLLLVSCQIADTTLKSNGFSSIKNKEDFYSFAKTLPLGITEKDDYRATLNKS